MSLILPLSFDRDLLDVRTLAAFLFSPPLQLLTGTILVAVPIYICEQVRRLQEVRLSRDGIEPVNTQIDSQLLRWMLVLVCPFSRDAAPVMLVTRVNLRLGIPGEEPHLKPPSSRCFGHDGSGRVWVVSPTSGQRHFATLLSSPHEDKGLRWGREVLVRKLSASERILSLAIFWRESASLG